MFGGLTDDLVANCLALCSTLRIFGTTILAALPFGKTTALGMGSLVTRSLAINHILVFFSIRVMTNKIEAMKPPIKMSQKAQ